MRHIQTFSKARPALAVETGLLTKSQGGLFGFNEWGDFALALATWVQGLPVIGPWLVVVPTNL